jgi:hypothetical protein
VDWIGAVDNAYQEGNVLSIGDKGNIIDKTLEYFLSLASKDKKYPIIAKKVKYIFDESSQDSVVELGFILCLGAIIISNKNARKSMTSGGFAMNMNMMGGSSSSSSNAMNTNMTNMNMNGGASTGFNPAATPVPNSPGPVQINMNGSG